MTTRIRSDIRPPVSPRARVLLGRADALLSRSVSAVDASEQFLDCYMAALRGAASVLEAAPRSSSRSRSRSAWVLMGKAAPDLEPWAEYFSGFSATRAAVQAGISRSIDVAASDDFYRQVGRFLHVVEDFIGTDFTFDRVDAVPHSIPA